MEKSGLRFNLPHPLVLLSACILIGAFLSYVLPAGEFARQEDNATGRTVVVAGTYTPVERSPVGLFDSSELRTLVKHREAKVRRQKCRLCGRPEHRRYLQQWEAPSKRRQSAFQLSFRHNTGDTIVRDLLRKPHRRSADVQD